MKYLLILTVASYALTAWSYHWAKGEGDNFGAIFVPLIGSGASIVLTIAYVVGALWFHKVW